MKNSQIEKLIADAVASSLSQVKTTPQVNLKPVKKVKEVSWSITGGEFMGRPMINFTSDVTGQVRAISQKKCALILSNADKIRAILSK